MNIEPGKTARRLGTLIPNPNAKLRDQFHEVCSIAGSRRGARRFWSAVAERSGDTALGELAQHGQSGVALAPWKMRRL